MDRLGGSARAGTRRARGGEIAPPPGGAAATPARRSRSVARPCGPCTSAFGSPTTSARSTSTRHSGYDVLGEVPETALGRLTMLKLPHDPFVTLELVHDAAPVDLGAA